MDPDEALKRLRDHTASILSNQEDDFEILDRATKVAELFQGLDEWLSSGGFKPVDWR